ncbi:alpha/beta hydrolase, partial [Streptomyces scabiei]|nr:alpha/beta hydrolase [Streptomyces scabiei]
VIRSMSQCRGIGTVDKCQLLVVHGDSDGYFPTDHPAMLAAAAGENGELWLERGMGHAENAASAELLARVGEWVAGRVR